MSTYRIRPLEWEHWTDELSDGSQDMWSAKAIGGEANICRAIAPGQRYCTQCGDQRMEFETIEQAQSWCTKQHEQAILWHLEVVI